MWDFSTKKEYYMRRIVSLLMAIVMMASFSTSAFATSSNINVDPNEDTVAYKVTLWENGEG